MCSILYCLYVLLACIRFEKSRKGINKICSKMEILSEITIRHNEVNSGLWLYQESIILYARVLLQLASFSHSHGEQCNKRSLCCLYGFLFDDAKVTEVCAAEVLIQQSNILFYQRINRKVSII